MPAVIAARIVGAVQLGAGVTMVLAPAWVARAAAGRGDLPPIPIVRILGIRIALQGALCAVRPSRNALLAGAGVDTIHLSSMVALAAVAPQYRRTALVSATLAAGSIGAGLGARR